MTIGSRLTRIERLLRVASDSLPSDDEVRWAYEVSNSVAVQQVLAEVNARFALTEEQIAFMNSAEVARAQAICHRHRRACGVGPIDFEARRRLPKHDLADLEAELAAKAAETSDELRLTV